MKDWCRGLLVLACCRRGGVLMEYVILTACVVLPLVGIFGGVFDPAGAVSGGSFGALGDAFVAWYRRVVCGAALPLP